MTRIDKKDIWKFLLDTHLERNSQSKENRVAHICSDYLLVPQKKPIDREFGCFKMSVIPR